MKVYDLKTFFNTIGYNWQEDVDDLSEICRLTKTRVKNPPPEKYLLPGTEQTFLLKSIGEWIKARSFFEIGTGRGTASYAVALLPHIERITTLDVIPFEKKLESAIGHRPAFVSNKDIYDLVADDSKKKISFKLRAEKIPAEEDIPEEERFDFCFIDGDHTNSRTIVEDFLTCTRVMKSDGVIVWDDYGQPEYSVKTVVDRILEVDPSWNATLVSFRGHLFGTERECDQGIVLMSKRELP